MSKEKSCQTCIHRWVCKKWDAAVSYGRKEWGGILEKMLVGMGTLIGEVCRKYKESQNEQRS